MSYALNSEDVLAICLILARGDTGAGMDQVMGWVAEYQEAVGDTFGTCEGDFQLLFTDLGLRSGLIEWKDVSRMLSGLEIFHGVPLRRWIRPVLQQQEACFNDSDFDPFASVELQYP